MRACRLRVPVHSAHVAFHARVHYPWHAAFGGEIEVLYEELRRDERVYVCMRPNDSTVVIPAWMCESAACANMKLGKPRASVAALEDVRVILTELGFHRCSTATETRPEESANESVNKSENHEGIPAATPAIERGKSRRPGRKESKGRRRGTGKAATRSRSTERKKRGAR